MNEETRRLPANTPDWTIPVAPGKSGVRRRTVLRGAAWSLPVIMAATANRIRPLLRSERNVAELLGLGRSVEALA